MKVLFVRIGWMEYYRGSNQNDPGPIGGGQYEEGHEAYNFDPIENRVYGFFEPPINNRISLNRILQGVRDEEEELDDVLVVYVASKNGDEDLVVVGWYNNAIVYRNQQMKGERQYGYFTETNIVTTHPLFRDIMENR